jgi:hypothetical protein
MFGEALTWSSVLNERLRFASSFVFGCKGSVMSSGSTRRNPVPMSIHDLECTILSQAVEEGPRLCRLFRDLGRKYNTSLSTAMFGSVPASPGHRKPRMCNTPHNRRYSIRSDSQCSLSARDISSLMFLPTLSRDLLTSTTLRCCALANRGFRDVRRTG